jgi:5-methylthioribose kinase
MTDNTLDIEQPEALLAYLRQTGRIGQNEQPMMTTLALGVSNRTVLVERPSGEAWVLKQALAKLRVKVDWFTSPERVRAEALGLRWLAELTPPETITPLVFEDFDVYLIAMQAVPRPHENWKLMLLNNRLQLDHFEQFGRLLASIHREAYRRRDEIASIFADNSFFLTLRIEPFYTYTGSQVEGAAAFLNKLADDTLNNRHTLVHGDFSPKNILVYQDKLILLDHEVIHWGDPAFDIGFSMAHFLSKANHFPKRRSDFGASAVRYWAVYRQRVHGLEWASDLEERAVRHTMGCLLARVAGRSTVEYLDADERARQREAILALIPNPPQTIPGFVQQFIGKLGNS